MHKIHTMPVQIYFKHCDPAGIVFYPRYVEMLHDTVEHWLNEGLAIGLDVLHGSLKMGIPTVNLQMDFHKPCYLGEHIEARLYVKRLGNSSMTLHIQLCDNNDTVRIEGDLTVVLVQMEAFQAIPISGELRDLITPYVK